MTAPTAGDFPSRYGDPRLDVDPGYQLILLSPHVTDYIVLPNPPAGTPCPLCGGTGSVTVLPTAQGLDIALDLLETRPYLAPCPCAANPATDLPAFEDTGGLK